MASEYPDLDHIRNGATAETQYLLGIIDEQHAALRVLRKTNRDLNEAWMMTRSMLEYAVDAIEAAEKDDSGRVEFGLVEKMRAILDQYKEGIDGK